MRERVSPAGDEAREPSGERHPVDTEFLRLASHISAAEATEVFERRLPGAVAEVEKTHHPFWWVVLRVDVAGILDGVRATRRPSAVVNVFVDAVSGKASIADFEPRGAAIDVAEWTGPTTLSGDVVGAAHDLVRTKVMRTVKLGMRVRLGEAESARGILKPNWLVRGANHRYSATFLVDGLDASHYVVRAARV